MSESGRLEETMKETESELRYYLFMQSATDLNLALKSSQAERTHSSLHGSYQTLLFLTHFQSILFSLSCFCFYKGGKNYTFIIVKNNNDESPQFQTTLT